MVLETRMLQIVNFVKEFKQKIVGFWRGVEIEKYRHEGAKAGNSKFHKRVSSESDRFLEWS